MIKIFEKNSKINSSDYTVIRNTRVGGLGEYIHRSRSRSGSQKYLEIGAGSFKFSKCLQLNSTHGIDLDQPLQSKAVLRAGHVQSITVHNPLRGQGGGKFVAPD